MSNFEWLSEAIERYNCGTGAGGFKRGNRCAKGDGAPAPGKPKAATAKAAPAKAPPAKAAPAKAAALKVAAGTAPAKLSPKARTLLAKISLQSADSLARQERALATSVVPTKEDYEFADLTEREITKEIGRGAKKIKQKGGYFHPIDIEVKLGGILHGIEVKTIILSKGRDRLSVKKGAVFRKVKWSHDNGFKEGKTRVHTLAVDRRDVYDGGAGKEYFTGHRLYYKRGNADYRFTSMHKCKDIKELLSLMEMDDKDKAFPKKARSGKNSFLAALTNQVAYKKLEIEGRKSDDEHLAWQARKKAKEQQ